VSSWEIGTSCEAGINSNFEPYVLLKRLPYSHSLQQIWGSSDVAHDGSNDEGINEHVRAYSGMLYVPEMDRSCWLRAKVHSPCKAARNL
jgi:hypothetical protein